MSPRTAWILVIGVVACVGLCVYGVIAEAEIEAEKTCSPYKTSNLPAYHDHVAIGDPKKECPKEAFCGCNANGACWAVRYDRYPSQQYYAR